MVECLDRDVHRSLEVAIMDRRDVRGILTERPRKKSSVGCDPDTGFAVAAKRSLLSGFLVDEITRLREIRLKRRNNEILTLAEENLKVQYESELARTYGLSSQIILEVIFETLKEPDRRYRQALVLERLRKEKPDKPKSRRRAPTDSEIATIADIILAELKLCSFLPSVKPTPFGDFAARNGWTERTLREKTSALLSKRVLKERSRLNHERTVKPGCIILQDVAAVLRTETRDELGRPLTFALLATQFGIGLVEVVYIAVLLLSESELQARNERMKTEGLVVELMEDLESLFRYELIFAQERLLSITSVDDRAKMFRLSRETAREIVNTKLSQKERDIRHHFAYARTVKKIPTNTRAMRCEAAARQHINRLVRMRDELSSTYKFAIVDRITSALRELTE